MDSATKTSGWEIEGQCSSIAKPLFGLQNSLDEEKFRQKNAPFFLRIGGSFRRGTKKAKPVDGKRKGCGMKTENPCSSFKKNTP